MIDVVGYLQAGTEKIENIKKDSEGRSQIRSKWWLPGIGVGGRRFKVDSRQKRAETGSREANPVAGIT